MKYLIIIPIVLIVYLIYTIALATWLDFRDRITEYNTHVCAVYGKMPDCKTELPEDRKLKQKGGEKFVSQYAVEMSYNGYQTVIVDAQTTEEARDKAMEGGFEIYNDDSIEFEIESVKKL